MKILGPVSNDEMQEHYPDLMEALTAEPATVTYCGHRDGLRTHSTDTCPNRADEGAAA